jgi:hypothetical protein
MKKAAGFLPFLPIALNETWLPETGVARSSAANAPEVLANPTPSRS